MYKETPPYTPFEKNSAAGPVFIPFQVRDDACGLHVPGPVSIIYEGFIIDHASPKL